MTVLFAQGGAGHWTEFYCVSVAGAETNFFQQQYTGLVASEVH